MTPKQAKMFALAFKRMGVRSFQLGEFKVEFEPKEHTQKLPKVSEAIDIAPDDEEVKLMRERLAMWSAS